MPYIEMSIMVMGAMYSPSFVLNGGDYCLRLPNETHSLSPWTYILDMFVYALITAHPNHTPFISRKRGYRGYAPYEVGGSATTK